MERLATHTLGKVTAMFGAACAASAVVWSVMAEPGNTAQVSATSAKSPVFATEIHVRRDFGALDTGKRGVKGEPILARCNSCHADHIKAPYARRPTDLKEFHVGKAFAHGTMACISCHDVQDRERLHLVDGTSIPLAEVQQLCGQCHGLQARDYAHGAHGGMNGYWDLSRGPRTRNGCVDCHNPHTPKYPSYAPVQKPRDRFLDGPHSSPSRRTST